jgi:hypothetical protein
MPAMSERLFYPEDRLAYCAGCGKVYKRNVNQRRYCSDKCSNKHRQRRFREEAREKGRRA